MAVKKMNLINIVGLLKDYEYVLQNFVMSHNIHLENAMSALENAKNLKPFESINPYSDKFKELSELTNAFPEIKSRTVKGTVSEKNIEDTVNAVKKIKSDYQSECNAIDNEIEITRRLITQLEPLRGIDFDISSMFDFNFVKVSYGKMPKESYKKLNTYLSDIEAFFIKGYENKDFVWGLCFAPSSSEDKINRIFSSLYFEKIDFAERVNGVPDEAIENLKKELADLEQKKESSKQKLFDYINNNIDTLTLYYKKICMLYKISEIKKYGVHSETSFYIVGWADDDEVKKLEHEAKKIPQLVVLSEPASEAPKHIKPPTLLKNNFAFKPFEFFVKMYGLPSYGEIDPTPVVAITYMLMFGIMFGDVGQGLVLSIAGFLLYKLKKIDLGAIAGFAGIFSIIFGFLYGSLFGYEDVIKATLIRPMENIMTMLGAAIALGVVIIVAAMILNVASSVKKRQFGRALFSQNGFAGLIFYLAIIVGIILMFVKGITVFTAVYNIIFIVIPLLMIFLQEPLTRLIAREKQLISGSKGEFVLESFFELFEILLSFVTNTISFVRVGAFALNHVGMMSVVFIFAKMASGAGSIAVVVIGNIFVMCLEGLIVGIQVLRLEFYEIFSRFYDGDGKEFKSIKQKEFN